MSLRSRLKRLAYSGWRYRCPLCGGTFSGMLPFGIDTPASREMKIVGGGRRERCLCPGCGSTDRERNVFLYLKEETEVFAPGTVLLHMAPERNLARILESAPGIFTVFGDRDRFFAAPGGNFVNLDMEALPFPEGCFDAVICNHVLEHVADDLAAIASVFSVLRSGGFAVMLVPLAPGLPVTREDPSVSSPADRERLFGQSDHVRLYGRDYPERLRKAGFEVEIFNYALRKGARAAEKYALNPLETIYVALKPG